jgi:hypothetical protein
LRGVSKDGRKRYRLWPSFEARRKSGEHLRMTVKIFFVHQHQIFQIPPLHPLAREGFCKPRTHGAASK